jgi:hypothetical protein
MQAVDADDETAFRAALTAGANPNDPILRTGAADSINAQIEDKPITGLIFATLDPDRAKFALALLDLPGTNPDVMLESGDERFAILMMRYAYKEEAASFD